MPLNLFFFFFLEKYMRLNLFFIFFIEEYSLKSKLFDSASFSLKDQLYAPQYKEKWYNFLEELKSQPFKSLIKNDSYSTYPSKFSIGITLIVKP